jgi:predicted MFS family arabinose efflux permease
MAIGSAVSGLIPNLVRLFALRGFNRADAAMMASATGLFVVVGRLSCGALLDRFWAPAVAGLYFLLAAAGCVELQMPGLTSAGAVIAAAAIGLTTGAEFDVMPYLAGRYFGVTRLGLAHGLISVMFFLGAGLGPLAFGRLIDLTSSYGCALAAGAGLFVLGSVLLLLLGRYPAAAGEEAA